VEDFKWGTQSGIEGLEGVVPKFCTQSEDDLKK
jgi:hypothetical protein